MSRAAYLRKWRAAYPHRVRQYNRDARIRRGLAATPEIEPSPEPDAALLEQRRIWREDKRAWRAMKERRAGQ